MDRRLIEGLMEAIAPVIKDSISERIERATAPLLSRIAELEARPVEKGDPGAPGRDGIDGRDAEVSVEQLQLAVKLLPLDDMISEATQKYLAEHPPMDGRDGLDGKDGAPGERGEVGPVGERGEKGDPGRDGIDGASGEKGENGDPGERGEKGDPGERGEKGEPGRDGRDGLPGVPGLPGEKGIDGRDGLGFDEYEEIFEDDGRFEVRRWMRDGQILKESRIKHAVMLYRGVWRPKEYLKGDVVTSGGSSFVAVCDTTADEKPEHCDAWQLSTKRGRAGKDAEQAQRKPAQVHLK